jgi:hypothetical protein
LARRTPCLQRVASIAPWIAACATALFSRLGDRFDDPFKRNLLTTV